MTENQYRRKWLRLHRGYERRAYVIFRNSIYKSVQSIPFDSMNEMNMRSLIELNVQPEHIYKAYYNTYLAIGSAHGKETGKAINQEIKRFTVDAFTEAFQRILMNWLTNNAGRRIITVRRSLIDHIIGLMEEGISEGKTIREIAKLIDESVRRKTFYRWQAMRIARTESTAAANFGATVAGDQSNLILEKVWLSAQDPRTRRRPEDKFDHLHMNGKRVGQKELFEVNGDLVSFPGDPEGAAGNVINCRCSVVLRGKRDANGRLMFKF